LREDERERRRGIVDVALLVLDAEGTLRVTDTRNMSAGKGAVVGGLLGAAVGLVTGGVGWLLVGGGAVGALARKARDGGIPDDRLRTLGERLTPGSSAVVVVVEGEGVAQLERDLVEQGADVVREAVAEDVAAQLDFYGEPVPAVGDVVAARTPSDRSSVDERG
jgi:uncharacterized membrane protein